MYYLRAFVRISKVPVQKFLLLFLKKKKFCLMPLKKLWCPSTCANEGPALPTMLPNIGTYKGSLHNTIYTPDTNFTPIQIRRFILGVFYY